MTVSEIIVMDLIDNDTEIFIQSAKGPPVLAHGNWYHDQILDYGEHEVENFMWKDDNKLYIDLK